MKKSLLFITILCFFLAGCDLYEHGWLEGADVTGTYEPDTSGDEKFRAVMDDLSGVWYSHYAGIGRLDGYRIGKWKDFKELVIDAGKGLENWDYTEAKTYSSGNPAEVYTPKDDDYFVFYDSSVYGQKEDNGPSAPGWEYNFGFCGIVRALNLFYNLPERGAIIIEYLDGWAPQWDADIKDGQLPFFGIYYRVLEPDIVQMANAVDLEALYKGKKYYTEKATLQEAIESNTVEDDADYITWGVVIPQDREK
jgi:hypothetical protein